MTKNKKEMSAKEKVQRQLWRNGYSAKDASMVAPYDLLVSKQIKVEVRSSEYKHAKAGIYWKFKNVNTEIADVLAVVITTPLDDVLIYYVKNSENITRKNNQDLKINTHALKTIFTSSPSKIFNK